MIIDLRYHIVSLVAVFLALGIGILVGSTLLGNDALVRQQKQLTDKLQVQMEQLRQKNETVQARANSLEIDNNIQKQFEKQVLPALVAGRLNGYRVAIVETNSYGFSDDLASLLHDAGAVVTSVTTVINGFDAPQKAELEKQLGWGNLGGNDLVTRMARETARGIVAGDNQTVINALTGAGLLKSSGDYGVPLDGVIIMGGSQDREMARSGILDLPMIDYFLGSKIAVFGVEETGAQYSYMPDYEKKRISTVDNIDTAPGRLALVLAMDGQPGHYGVKSTAQKLLPDLNPGGGAENAGNNRANSRPQ
ncbi:copper transporter [Desulfotomaculum copahuensis]|uniref:Copper transporter n=1 Tax=Desulfotomaculum copahuensis TaxID=1838280 RepID=A0A1B7LIV6_9FIRM|nr:copper transporter [Desulfotomaculum copahuensis]OAT86510.1 hypothetical protein A6M21_03605 [Desulfotomaculum copahuensis]